MSIENENGDCLIEKTSEKEIPYIEEFDKQDFRTSFDQIEKAILTGRKEVSDNLVTEYLNDVSKKKIHQECANTPETIIIESPHLYEIEAELGSIDVVTHKLSNLKGKTVYSIATDYFENKNTMQRFQSPCILELTLKLASNLSYRPETDLLNRIRQQETGIKTTTLRNTVENQGKSINDTMHNKAEEALLANGFTVSGNILPNTEVPQFKIKTIDEEKVMAVEEELGISEDINLADYEAPEQTVNISADDVISDRQATNRPDSPEKGQKKYVSNTVVHVQKNKNAYIINDRSVKGALKLLMGFLLSNALIGFNQFVFFTDGATDLNDPINAMFGFLPYKIILDWYHLLEKVKQRLSMGMKGYKVRNAFIDLLQPVLWRGDITAAIAMLEGLSDELVKKRSEITRLIEYLKRNQKYIPCYLLRSHLGLRNSSNCVENANGRVVSFRQKARGMSWSREGSTGLATVSAATINGELKSWTEMRTLDFTLHTEDDTAA